MYVLVLQSQLKEKRMNKIEEKAKDMDKQEKCKCEKPKLQPQTKQCERFNLGNKV